MLVIEGNELKMNKKCVLVTGASSGIGSSIARKFASNNYNIILHYNTHEEDAINLKKELEKETV
jgi:short-subunit dehydrogenase